MAYVVVTWLVLQVADTAVPLLHLPEWVSSFVLLLLGLFFIPTLVFAWAFELTPEGIKLQAEVDRDQSITGVTGRKLDYVTIAALVLVLIVVASEHYLFPPQPVAATAALEAGEISIAVLPFSDMSPNKDQEYFSDGITEEILNGLAKLKTMKVAGRTSAFAFKGRNEDLREIGLALGVEHVVEGSVRKDGNTLRITAQLIKVSDGFHMWSETYDRELNDVFAVQDEISAAIVGELRGSLLGDFETESVPVQIDVATYEKYLDARQHIYRRSNEGLTEARALLEEVIAEAPGFAPGLSSLAETLLLLRGDIYSAYGDLDADYAIQEATRLLDRAVEIDPELADAYAVRGLMLGTDQGSDSAEDALARAVELNPSLSKAWLWRANNVGSENALQGIEYLKKAVAIDPLWLVPNANLTSYYQAMSRVDEVWQILERLRPFHSDSAQFHRMDGDAKAASGGLADAHRAFARAYELSPDTPAVAGSFGFSFVSLESPAQAYEVFPAQFVYMRNFLTGEWDADLPGMRAAAEANPSFVFAVALYGIGASYSGDYEAIASFYDEFVDSPEFWAQGDWDFLFQIYIPPLQALGRTEDVAELLAAFRGMLEIRALNGFDNPGNDYSWAELYLFNGDSDAALARLQKSVDRGNRPSYWQYGLEWQPLAQDPRLIAIQQQVLTAVNVERAALGWEPVPELGTFYDPGSIEQ